ncbi:hypothetical protein H0G86_011460 [Trichoderma simmonsii]|uniref:Nephrocystin 3-like N-terminal domain-containing protein n=1 Tax=Trichoderma simmonsii TaxID=1491479 RepID=A0A8G0LLK7_9HYPO|nr:hypothetical protein H0G86_011460 [Trichoderma simmonsii]
MSRKSIGNFPFTLGTFLEKIIRVNGEEEDNKATEDLVSLLNTALHLSYIPEQNEWLQVMNSLSPPEQTTALPLQNSTIVMDKVLESGTYLAIRDSKGPIASVIYGTHAADIAHKVYQSFQEKPRGEGRLALRFVFDRHDQRRNSVVSMASSFIAQILSASDTFSGNELFFRQRKEFHSWSPYDALFALYQLSTGKEILFVIDNIDQCDSRSRESFFQHFSRPLLLSDSKIKLILTAENALDNLDRLQWKQLNANLKWSPEDDITNKSLQPCEGTNGDQFGNLEAAYIRILSAYLPSPLPSSANLEKLLMVISNFNCSNKIVALTIEASLSVPVERLSRIDPTTPQSIPRQMLDSIPESGKILFQQIMSWVLCSLQPLSIQQLASIVAWIQHHEVLGNMAHDKFFCLRTLSPILELLWGFLVIENNQIGPSHPSVRKLFTESEGEWFSVTDKDHAHIALLCLEFLQLEEHKQWENTIKGFEYRLNPAEAVILPASTFEDRSSLSWYAIKSWTEHYKRATISSEIRGEVAKFFSEDSKLSCESWAEAKWIMSNPISRGNRPLKSSLPLLTELGDVDLLKDWITNTTNLHQKPTCEEFGAALVRATFMGDVKVVEYLLGLDNDYAKHGLEESLVVAAASENSEILQELILYAPENFTWPGSLILRVSELGLEESANALLSRGCSPDTPVGTSDTVPLLLAARNGHKGICEILLQYLTSENADKGASIAVAVIAARSPCGAEVLSILLGHGYNIMGNDITRKSALQTACELGHFEVVKTFLSIVKKGGSQPSDTNRCLNIAIDRGFSRTITNLLDIVKLGMKNEEYLSIADQHLERAIKNNSESAVATLLLNGANANTRLSGKSMLYQACCRDEVNLAIVMLLVENGANIRASSGDASVLAPVIRRGDSDCLQYLISSGTDVNKPVSGDLYAIHLAAALGNIECVRILLKEGARVDQETRSGVSAIVGAASQQKFEVVDFLLDKGANISGKGFTGRNMLQLCVVSPHILRRILEIFPDPNLKDDQGLAAIHHAILNSQTEAVKILAEFHADVNVPMPEENGQATPLMMAVIKGNLAAVQYLLDAGADVNHQANKRISNSSAIHFAKTAEIIGALLQYGADVNKKDSDGDTALHRIANSPSPDLGAAKRLINARADVNARDKHNRTPLYNAVNGKHTGIIDYLLSKGADPNIADPRFGSPLHRACWGGNIKMVKQLHAAGAMVDLAVEGSGSPLQNACLSRSNDNDVVAVVQYLVEDAKADVNQICGLNGTAVHAACLRGSPAVLRLLLDKYNANPQVPDKIGRLPIHIAAVTQIDSFQYLVKLGCDMNAADKTGRNLLHWAAQSANIRIVSLILSQPDVSIDAIDKSGWTALCWAARGSSHIVPPNIRAQTEIIELLLKKGANKSVTVQGDGDETWTPLEIAIFHETGDNAIQLLMEQPVSGGNVKGKKRRKLNAPQKRGKKHGTNAYCDCCQTVSA